MFPYFQLFPWIPTNCNKPPTLYALLNSMLNFEVEDKTKIQDLARIGHSKVFNFDYPLSEKVNKDNFETMIINHFLMRRIGYDTFTAFQIALNVKMNEIMPYYNKLLDFVDGWDLFNDGETTTRIQTDTRDSNTTINSNITTSSTSNSSSDLSSTTTINDSNTQDLRHSEMPQDQLEDIRNGKYLSTYDYNISGNNSTTNINNNVDDQTETNNNTTKNDTSSITDNTSLEEKITRSPADKMAIFKNFVDQTNSIYTMIFKDLDSLFYQII